MKSITIAMVAPIANAPSALMQIPQKLKSSLDRSDLNLLRIDGHL
jgi:hypothetical protein